MNICKYITVAVITENFIFPLSRAAIDRETNFSIIILYLEPLVAYLSGSDLLSMAFFNLQN